MGEVISENIVDYTPRMISRTITTGGVTFLTDVNGDIDYSNGVASVTDWGLLGSLGIEDAQARFDGSPGTIEVAPGVFENERFIGAQNPGVSPTNGWFTLFGQFFDHGLDFIDKGAQGKTIKIALAEDDPLYGVIGPDGMPATSITISRANVAGFDETGTPLWTNHTSPFIDQSQTYGSSDAITELLREWVIDPVTGTWRPGMNMLDGTTLATQWKKPDGTMSNDTLPTLNELRAHVVATGRADLTWADVSNYHGSDQALILDMNPRFDTAHLMKGDAAQDTAVVDAIAALNADAQATYGPTVSFYINGDGVLQLDNLPGAPPSLTGASALFAWVNLGTFGVMQTHAGTTDALAPEVASAVGTLLMAAVGDHYIAGDGRVNENVGLTTVHHVFHEEHNFQIQNIINAITREADARSGRPGDGQWDAEYMKEFQVWDAPGAVWNATTGNYEIGGEIAWDLDVMFNAAKLTVEMEYQHVAIDQYARTVTPDIKEFVGYTNSENPSVSLEYAQSIFRFGHSQLRETIDTIDPDHGLTGKIMGYALKLAFLNPDQFSDIGPGAIALGMTHQQGNEIDEIITPALNQGLLGLPLDLAAINIARGRDVGMPGLNEMRTAVGLRAYEGWADFGLNMAHPDNLVNFMAAYSFDGDVAKAAAVLALSNGDYSALTAADAATALGLNPLDIPAAEDYAFNFMNGGDKGVDAIDSWIGGLAEVHVTGGLLGETFNLVFVDQMERLQDGDRFYYLYRLAGQQFADEIAGGQFKDIIERNTGLTHLGGSAFSYNDQYYELGGIADATNTVNNNHKWGTQVDALQKGVFSDGGTSQSRDGNVMTVRVTDPFTGVVTTRQFIRDTRVTDPNAPNGGEGIDGAPNSGADSTEVIVGTQFDDVIHARGGDDTVYGEGGNDIIYGENGIDRLYGGDGKDYIYGGDGAELTDGGAGDDFIWGDSSATAAAGVDQLMGGMGNDYISGGIGIDKLAGGGGDDVIMGEGETDPFTHGGDGNDYIDGGITGDLLYGDNGDDVIVGGADQDLLYGGDGDDLLRPGNPSQALGGGPDEVLGGDGITDTGFDIIDFSDNLPTAIGIVFDLTNQANPLVQIDGNTPVPTAAQVEGIVGSVNNDTLTGDSRAGTSGSNWVLGGSGDDTLRGGLGNDVIIGGSMRLDDMIGRYDSGYTHNNANDSATGTNIADVDASGATHYYSQDVLDQLYQGASHRVAWDDTLDNSGLIDAINAQTGGADLEKHFTEMLRSERFKDLSLGDAAGQTNGGTDTVVFTGNSADYTFEAITFVDHAGNTHNGLRVTDTVADRDGSDVVVDVDSFQFANASFTLAQLTPPTVSVNDVTLVEGDAGTTNAVFTISLSQAYLQDITVSYGTADGTAAAPGDYAATSGTVTILAGSTSATVNVAVAGDQGLEANETFNFNLTSASNGATIADGSGLGTITDDDVAIHYTAYRPVGGAMPGLGQIATLSAIPGASYTYQLLSSTSPDAGSFAMVGNSVHRTGLVMQDNSTYTLDLQATNSLIPATDVKTVTIKTGGAITNDTLTAAAGDTVLYGQGGNDTMTGGTGDDTIDGGAGNDTVIVGGSRYNYSWDLDGNSFPVITDLVGGEGSDNLVAVEAIKFGGVGGIQYGFAGGNANRNIVRGTAAANSINGAGNDDILVAGAGNDTITYNVDNLAAADGGRDLIFGGAGNDTFVLNGNGSAEDFYIYSRDAFLAANPGATIGAASNIVITRNGSTEADIVAELNSIEEIKVNTTTNPNTGTLADGNNYTGPVSGDQVHVIGNFIGTGLAYNTITVDGGLGNDTVDIAGLTSDHRVVFNTGGGEDSVVGTLRPQDIVNGALGLTSAPELVSAPELASLPATLQLQPVIEELVNPLNDYLGTVSWNNNWAAESVIQPGQLTNLQLDSGMGQAQIEGVQSFESFAPVEAAFMLDEGATGGFGNPFGLHRYLRLSEDGVLDQNDRLLDFGHHYLA